ncbi:12066_t:CDS:2 [Rhizophagus irregularis]|nr:12066_t:CDS:2 [Rhizophagus irregularis]
MKCIVFIIVFLNTFSNTFAWVLIMIAQVSVTVHGPQRVSNPGHVPCCLQQGPMIIGNYIFYKGNPEYLIATIWEGRKWVNGYSEDNSVDPNV